MKPSKITHVVAKTNRFICPPGFIGLTFKGVVYTRKKSSNEKINKTEGIDSAFENHELIHVHQAVSTNDSWLLFYVLYIWQWILNLPLIFINIYAPYKFIAFEMEAYANENYMDYNLSNTDVKQWKDYNKLSLRKKWRFAKEYYSKYRKKMPFGRYVEDYVKNEQL